MREEHVDKLKLLQVRYKYKTCAGIGGARYVPGIRYLHTRVILHIETTPYVPGTFYIHT